jgi:putative membrane protein
MVREEDDYIVRSWWASFKGNLRQSFGWWLPVLALLVLAVAENWLIGGIRGATLAGALTGLIALGAAIVVGILSWLCPLVAQFDNTVAGHVSSACILAGAHPVRTAANLAVGVAPLAFFLLVPDARGAAAWFAVLIGLSFTGYVHALIEKGPFDRLRSAQDPSGA